MKKGRLFMIVGALLAIGAVYYLSEPGYRKDARVFAQYVRSNRHKYDAIKEWGTSLPINHTGAFQEVSHVQWSDTVKQLSYRNWRSPSYVLARGDPRTLVLVYGGGLGHWGLIIDMSGSGHLEEFAGDFLLKIDDIYTVWWDLQQN